MDRATKTTSMLGRNTRPSLLRTMAVADNRFDRYNVAEEVETLGRSERDAVRSQVRRIIEHLLKPAYSPAHESRHGWMSSIAEARHSGRQDLRDVTAACPECVLEDLYRDGREIAELARASLLPISSIN